MAKAFTALLVDNDRTREKTLRDWLADAMKLLDASDRGVRVVPLAQSDGFTPEEAATQVPIIVEHIAEHHEEYDIIVVDIRLLDTESAGQALEANEPHGIQILQRFEHHEERANILAKIVVASSYIDGYQEDLAILSKWGVLDFWNWNSISADQVASTLEAFLGFPDPVPSRKTIELKYGEFLVDERKGKMLVGHSVASRKLLRDLGRAGEVGLEVVLANAERKGSVEAGRETAEKEKAEHEATAFKNRSVLILGSSGTGKERAARFLNNMWVKAAGRRPMEALNVAEIPPQTGGLGQLIALFGAVPGVMKDYYPERIYPEGVKGLFERNHQGTVFLDEIGELSTDVGAMLLRVLQERYVIRFGANPGNRDKRYHEPIHVNVNIIAATDSKLLERVRDKTFIPALFNRLAQTVVHVPTLNERREDVPHFFATLLAERLELGMSLPILTLGAREFLSAMVDYSFGEFRLLERMVEHAASCLRKRVIEPLRGTDVPIDYRYVRQKVKDEPVLAGDVKRAYDLSVPTDLGTEAHPRADDLFDRMSAWCRLREQQSGTSMQTAQKLFPDDQLYQAYFVFAGLLGSPLGQISAIEKKLGTKDISAWFNRKKKEGQFGDNVPFTASDLAKKKVPKEQVLEVLRGMDPLRRARQKGTA